MALTYQPITGNMPQEGPASTPADPAAYHRAIQQSAPQPDEIDRLRMTFGFVPASSAVNPDPFWAALAMTLAQQHEASDDLQQQASQKGQEQAPLNQPSPAQPSPDQPSLNPAPGT